MNVPAGLIPKDQGLFSSYDMFLNDSEGRPLVLFRSAYRLRSFQENHPQIKLWEHPPV